MTDKKQFSVPVTLERLLRFNIHCKVSGKNQEEVFAELIDNHIPNRGLNIKEM